MKSSRLKIGRKKTFKVIMRIVYMYFFRRNKRNRKIRYIEVICLLFVGIKDDFIFLF